MPRRSRLETINLLLLLARDGMLSTHLMYRANLSHLQLKKYLEFLLKKQLLTRQEDRYFTTGQGRAFIKTFQKIQALLELPKLNSSPNPT